MRDYWKIQRNKPSLADGHKLVMQIDMGQTSPKTGNVWKAGYGHQQKWGTLSLINK